MSAIRLPNLPPIATKPKKAIIVVIVAQKTGDDILFAAFSAAVVGSSPNFLNLKSACSPTTIASSTTMPKVIINANKEIMLKVKPAAYISATAPAIATGTPAATQIAVLAFRNKNSKRTTKPKPKRPFSSNILIRPVIASALARIS